MKKKTPLRRSTRPSQSNLREQINELLGKASFLADQLSSDGTSGHEYGHTSAIFDEDSTYGACIDDFLDMNDERLKLVKEYVGTMEEISKLHKKLKG